MSELTRVVLDCMGGDNAPMEIVKGGVEAINSCKEITLILVGDKESIESELSKYSYDKERIEIVHTTEVI